MKKFALLALLSLAGLLACDTKEITPNESRLGFDYFPLSVGQFALYDVEQTTYFITSPAETVQYQLKEVVADTFTDQSKELAYRLHRYTRPNAQTNWPVDPDSVWTAKRTPRQALRTENNVTFVKLSFPVTKQLAWNGNQFNNRGQDEYEVMSFDQPYALLGNAFEKTIQVVQQNDSSACDLDRRLEMYARGVGLIYQEKVNYTYVQKENSQGEKICEGKGQIAYGTRYILRLREYGQVQ